LSVRYCGPGEMEGPVRVRSLVARG
jgi:hypothetical protein